MFTVEQVKPVVRPLLTTCNWFSTPAVSASPAPAAGAAGRENAVDGCSQLQDRPGAVHCGSCRSQRGIHVGLRALDGHDVAQGTHGSAGLRVAIEIDQRGLHDGVPGTRLVRFGEHMVVAQDIGIAVLVRDQCPQRAPAAVVDILTSRAVFAGVVVVGVAARCAHLDVARLRRLVLQPRAIKSGAIEQNVKRRDRVSISSSLPHQVHRWAARGQCSRGSIGCGARGIAPRRVAASAFADAAVAVTRIVLARRRRCQRPVDRAGIALGDLSFDLDRSPWRHAGGFRGKNLDKSGGHGERVGCGQRGIAARGGHHLDLHLVLRKQRRG